ncbi:MAG TPA: hypothetical protein VN421_05880 [Pseudoflavonifractor sp.]|nr:hypothetical protein [Pseudoflavonifractor sp.]
MEDTKKDVQTEGITGAAKEAKNREAELREKYGKVYRVSQIVPIDDEEEKEFNYYFKRPSVPSYDRYIKGASQSMTKASKVFMLDAVVDEDRDRLVADMEEYPGVALTIGNKLTELLGLTNTVNLKRL